MESKFYNSNLAKTTYLFRLYKEILNLDMFFWGGVYTLHTLIIRLLYTVSWL